MRMIGFEEGLSNLFRNSDGRNLLTLMALAQAAGRAERLEEWLIAGPDSVRRTRFWAGPIANKSIKEIVSAWQILCDGKANDIQNAFAASDRDELDTMGGSLIRPLTILDRGHIVVALHEELLNRGETAISEAAALTLAEFGDWERALAILTGAHRDGASPRFNLSTQDLLWKHAYLQGHADTVLPKLAAIPFDRNISHAKGLRAWQLLAYQIRAGRSDVCVPVVEPKDQTPGYVEAAVIQIADLADESSEANTVRELRRVLKTTKPIKMDVAGRGLSFEVRGLSEQLFKAEVQITARRKDYPKAAALARSSSHNPFIFASDVVIDAFID